MWDINIGVEGMRILGAGVNTTQQPSGRVVGLRVEECSISVGDLSIILYVFTECSSSAQVRWLV